MSLDDCDAILARVAREHGFRPMLLLRTQHGKGELYQSIHRAKRAAMFAMREAGASLPKIARVLALRHHQPVIRGLRLYAKERTTP